MQFPMIVCKVCNREISTGGAAYSSHMRMHVRNGKLVELKRGNKLLFMTKEELTKLIEMEPYCVLGYESMLKQPKDVWDATESLRQLCPINPRDYYTTSGEAIQKTQKLIDDTKKLLLETKSFLNKLIKSKGQKKYLESSWDDNKLLVKAKNPRKLPENVQEGSPP